MPMLFKRIKSEGLAHNSYILGSGGLAAVIDPRRDIQIYLDTALEQGLKIGYIFETHRNEDYIIGSLPLAAASGAPVGTPVGTAIYHGPGLDWKYGTTLQDGQEFHLGKLKLPALHTPGHTGESMSYSLTDTSSGTRPGNGLYGRCPFRRRYWTGGFLRTGCRTPHGRRALSQYLEKILPLGMV